MKRILQLAICLALSPLVCSAADLAILQNGFEIRHEQREVVGTTTRLYLSSDHNAGYVDVPTDQIVRYEHDDSIQPRAAAAPAQASPEQKVDIPAVVQKASQTHLVDSDLIASVIHAESRFNPRAVSPKGAQGLMQLMPGTAAKLGVTDAFDPHANVDGGTRYLRELLVRYNDDIVKALAAYNAGPHRVDQYHGVPPFRETRAYVASIVRDFNQKKLAQQKAAAASTTHATSARKSAVRKTQRRAHVHTAESSQPASVVHSGQ